jgi:tetratricopeptide (TPR) repeat protein
VNLKKWKPYAAPVATIAALTLIAYANIYRNPFVFDDLPYIVRNPFIRSLDNLGALWTYAPTRFLTYFSLLLNYRFFQLDVVSYHVVNVLIHLITGIVVYFLALELGRRVAPPTDRPKPAPTAGWIPSGAEGAALAIALIFVCHPAQTEAVTYVWQRGASLAALFYLSALLSYVSSVRRHPKRISKRAIFFTVLAVFTKQISATLPAALLLLEWLVLDPREKAWRPKLKRLFPVALATALLPITMWFAGDYDWRETHSHISTAIVIPSRWEYLLTQINVIRDYYRVLFFPLHQNVDYDVPLVKTLRNAEFLLSLTAHLAVLLAVYRLRKRWPLITFGMFFFYIALSVESSIVPLADVQFEHRLYLPSFGFWIAVVTAAHALRRKYAPEKWQRPAVAMTVTALICVIGTGLTLRRNRVWSSPEIFWRDIAAKSPAKARSLVSLGRILTSKDNSVEAITLFERAAIFDPRNTMAHFSLALRYLQDHQYLKAYHESEELEKIDPEIPEYHYLMASLYLISGKEPKAIELLKKAVSPESLAKNSPDVDFVRKYAFENLLTLSINHDDMDGVILAANGTLNLEPLRNDVRARLAYALGKKKDFAAAEREYQTILRINPDDFSTYNNLAVLLESAGKLEQAAATYERALERWPHETAPKINLVLLLASSGKKEKAERLYKELPDLGQESWRVYALMGRKFYDLGYYDLAIDSLDKVIEHSPADQTNLIVEMHAKLSECYNKLGNRGTASIHSQKAKEAATRKTGN